MNQPSEEALRKMIRFLIKTSVPRLIEKKRIEAEELGKLQEVAR